MGLPELNIELGFLQEKYIIMDNLNAITESTSIDFTDGSRDPVSGRAGFGVYVEQIGLKIGRHISNASSVLTTELMAILLMALPMWSSQIYRSHHLF